MSNLSVTLMRAAGLAWPGLANPSFRMHALQKFGGVFRAAGRAPVRSVPARLMSSAEATVKAAHQAAPAAGWLQFDSHG